MSKEGIAETPPARALGHTRYRDELNFAEFPIATVSDTVADNVKTLEFTDEIFDPSTGKPVTRTLAITAADKFGLPTALDDEVLLGLMQLSCDRGFTDRKVHFSRYELIKLLGWRDESKSYKRIEESLNRWTGVTLQYKKAWWSKEEQCWVNETFHVIDQVTVFDRERIERRRKMAKDSPEKALSSFVWNDTVFQSFQSGYIKALDFDFYKSLDSAISKRMFRFLDKRFYHKGRWEFDLRAFACEHIGLSKNYSNSELKRKLLPAVKELVARGITKRSAVKLVTHHPEARVRGKIRLFDSLKTRGGEGAIRNRAGWLYAAIVHDYASPDATPKERVVKPLSAPVTVAPTKAEPYPAEPQEPKPDTSVFDAFWAAMSDAKQAAFEEEAVLAAPAFLQKQYHDGKDAKGTLWRVTRQRILMAHFLAALDGRQG